MMKCNEVMTTNPVCCLPNDSVAKAAQLMKSENIGSIPVIETEQSQKLVGIVTDRDLALRAVAAGKDVDTRLSELMTPVAMTCGQDDDLRDVEQKMAELQVRRIPIVDAGGRCLGIISQADIARAASLDDGVVTGEEVALVVEQISQPTHRIRNGGAREEPRVSA